MNNKQPVTPQGYGIWDTNIDGKRIAGFTPDQWFDREKEHAAAIERKDALLRQALKAMRSLYGGWRCESVCNGIEKELGR